MLAAIHAARGAELAALATRDPEKAAPFRDFCPALAVHDSYEALLADPEALPVRDALLYTYYFEPPYPTPTVQALVTARYKLIGRLAPGWDALYATDADPYEARDLAPYCLPARVAGRAAYPAGYT